AAISSGFSGIRPAAIAPNGTMEVCAAKDCQAAPSARRRLASIDTVPASAVTAREPKKMNEARSPLAIRCTAAHNPTPRRNGWALTRQMPPGRRVTRPSPPKTGVRRGQSNHRQEKGGKHENDRDRFPPYRNAPGGYIGCMSIGHHEPYDADEG